MNDASNIERRVMARVHRIHRLRPVLSGASVSLVASALALWGIGREVWVAKVFENAPKDLLALPHFAFAAFDHTSFLVQAFTLVALVGLAYFARETARLLSRAFEPVRA